MVMTQFGHVSWPGGRPDLSEPSRAVRGPLWLMTLLLLGIVLLAGCGERPRAAAARPPAGPEDRASALAAPVAEAGTQTGAGAGAAGSTGMAGGGRSARRVTPLFHGEPLWAENRHGGAEDNARYQFEHRGTDIGARSLEDYLTRVHAFFDHPPADVETTVRASNGDRLLYSPGANLFGVQRKDGAPRLLMRPVSGRAYWEGERARASGPNLSDQAAR